MKPRVLALDFDGTIAVNDTIDADVAAAIQEARTAGLLVVLVTGRTLSDLDALSLSPPPFDAIVAENGAVLWLPNLPSPIMLSQGPDLHFLAELHSRGIRHQRGHCVVDASADVAPQIVEIIRRLGLPLAITFNLSRLMILPHGVSKASGLQEALWRLRASVAIGTSEGLALLANLAIDEAVLLPGPLESGDSLKRFRVAPRLAAHVRHRRKYADVPVRLDQEFVFTQAGRPMGKRARAVRDLLSALPELPADVVQGHLDRGDFHRWIEDVFGDSDLGGAIRFLERAHLPNVREALVHAIADRYGGYRGDC